jgi:two-component system OmpR family response regulator
MVRTEAAPLAAAIHSGTEPRLLIVDDDEELCQHMAAYLAKNDFVVETACDGATMDRALADALFDVIILDVMMPGEDGLSICRRLAAAPPSIIIMSAIGEDVDRIIGLELGADDYLAKPCNPRELLARVRAVLRRRERALAGAHHGRPTYRFAGYELDATRHRLRGPSGATVLLARGEFALLTALLDHPGETLTRERLADFVRDDTPDHFDRSIDVQIHRLRRKLGDDGGQGVIRTVRGEGYRLATPVARL